MLCFSLPASVRLLSSSADVGAVSTLCRHCDEGLGLWRIRREKIRNFSRGVKSSKCSLEKLQSCVLNRPEIIFSRTVFRKGFPGAIVHKVRCASRGSMDSDELAGSCSAAVCSQAGPQHVCSRLDLEAEVPISGKKRNHGPLPRASLLQVE